MLFESRTLRLSPFEIDPIFMTKVWGSPNLRPWYDFDASKDPIGEVWLTGDDCKALSGALAGTSLQEIFARYPESMLGEAAARQAAASPLLLKVIFAKEKLSVQVHPDDRMAQKYGDPRGKTECWYALAADPGAAVAAGLLPGVTLEKIEDGVLDHTLEQSLKMVPVSAGDMIYVDAGTVHAILPGSVLLETQQNCDITYRLYDYGRPRELHVAKALEATRLETDAGKVKPVERGDRTILIEKGYFCVEKMKVEGIRSGRSMLSVSDSAGSGDAGQISTGGLAYLFAAAGAGRILPVEIDDAMAAFEAVELPTRGIVAIPASSPDWLIEDLGGLELIRVTPRWPAASESNGSAHLV